MTANFPIISAGMLAAYILGAVPVSYIVAKIFGGVDITRRGSGNVGATNVLRTVGRLPAAIALAGDILKGAAAVTILAKVMYPAGAGMAYADFRMLLGLCAICGHIWTVFLKFKGGKGVATSFGVALGLWPYFTVCALVALAVWIAVVLTWRYVSLASISAAVVFPIALVAGILNLPHWHSASLWPLVVAAIVIPILVIVRHRENIRRLVTGAESKVRSRTSES